MCKDSAPWYKSLSSTKAKVCPVACTEKDGGVLGQDQNWFVKRVMRESHIWKLPGDSDGFAIKELGFWSQT